MASSDVFSAEEYGTGSRRTPLIDAPVWVKAQARREGSPDGDRATLTPGDRAFLDSEPSYEELESPLGSLPPPAVPTPSMQRRLLSLLLFVAITGAASAVLGLAVLRLLGRLP